MLAVGSGASNNCATIYIVMVAERFEIDAVLVGIVPTNGFGRLTKGMAGKALKKTTSNDWIDNR
jgi:hypothetical protein